MTANIITREISQKKHANKFLKDILTGTPPNGGVECKRGMIK